MSTSSATAAHAFKAAFVAAIQALYAANDEVLVTFGHPGPQVINYNDAISFTSLSVEQDPATMSNRSREEVLTLMVTCSARRYGGFEVESAASDAAYGMLEAIERYARVTDTTIGGTVRHCFMRSHVSEGMTMNDEMGSSRVIEVEATFEARVRITG